VLPTPDGRRRPVLWEHTSMAEAREEPTRWRDGVVPRAELIRGVADLRERILQIRLRTEFAVVSYER